MSLIKINAQGAQQDIAVYEYQVALDDAGAWLSGEFVEKSSQGEPLYIAPLAHLPQAQAQNTAAVPLLSADATIDEIEQLSSGEAQTLAFLVSDFRDGRTFSLVRHARHQGFGGEIVIIGDFALDQANYFVKSGVDAFIVPTDQVATLTNTLQDLASAYHGDVVSALPLFR